MQYFYPLFAYILGSIPFGLILSKAFGDGKIRQRGSKNIGATNAFRTQGKAIGALTLALDFLKGFAACYFLKTDSEIINLATLAAPVVGHVFPIWLRFRGGKGVATYLGVLCALSPFVFGGTAVVWVSMFLITKISAVAGLLSVAMSLVIFAYTRNALCLPFANQLLILIGLVLLIIVKHSDNIKRLVKGEER
ncbi:MAG: glycerol-3-phosphate 1-O-acyltransferase PlsY [Holosporaceae bacterium]|jgi:glycerol-3-phosphate acyltransferase PlsY|nr:glycerol-3-phosphate 1-O-acyltransferase PlsY [Holosporaceae bacterium]